MSEAFVCDAVRTPIGRYGGALSKVRADDLAALPIKELIKRWNPEILEGFKKSGGHRAMEDVLESIEELKFYKDKFFI